MVKKLAGMALLLALLCLAAFQGVRENGFINLDDRLYLTENPMVARGLSLPGLGWAFTTTRAGNWHPLTWLSHMLDVQLFGMEPGRHHLMSLALHVAAALLLFAALRAMTSAAWLAFFAAALFAAHPMRVESVAWASERKDVLALLFTLLALLAYVRDLRRPGARLSPLTAGCYALALLAKPTPVTFPFLLLLLDWWPLGRWAPGGAGRKGGGLFPPAALWREKAPLFALAAASSAITLFAQAEAGALVPSGALPLAVRAVNALVSYAEYLAATAWPRGLSVFYPHPTSMPPWPAVAASLLLLGSASAAAWRLRRRLPWLTVGWLWFLAAFVPMIGLIQVGAHARADRYTYLPHVGIAVAAAWGLGASLRGPRLRTAAGAAGAAAVLGLAVATASLIPGWRSSVELFSRAIELTGRRASGAQPRPSPALAFVHNSLGVAYFDAGRLEEAIAQYRTALALNPSSYVTMNNLAKALEAAGQGTEANALYVRALADTRLSQPRVNLGMMLMARGSLDDAIQLFDEALAIDPIDVVARAELGAALAMSGRVVEAERVLRAAIALGPDYEPAQFNLGKLLHDQQRYAEAIGPLRESLRLEPGQKPALEMLRAAIAAAGG